MTFPNSTRFKSVVWVIVALTCLRVWFGPFELTTSAQAQIPNAGADRQELINAARETNRLLAEIAELLRNGTLNVRTASTDKNDAGLPNRPVQGR